MQKIFSLFPKVSLMLSIFMSVGLGLTSNNAYASLSSKAATPSQILQNKDVVKNSAKDKHVKAAPAKKAASEKVLTVYHNWVGTRYRLGGESRAGIDCSAFTRETMRKAFNFNLPRSTAEQKYVGHSIAKSQLQAGDLIFFRKNHHVGVYIGNGKFVHSSSSRGVTTSSIHENYWSRNYSQSRRVL